MFLFFLKSNANLKQEQERVTKAVTTHTEETSEGEGNKKKPVVKTVLNGS